MGLTQHYMVDKQGQKEIQIFIQKLVFSLSPHPAFIHFQDMNS